MYHNIKSCVQFVNPQDQNDPNASHFSDYFTSNIGVRQWENLSPILCSLFLNDLEEYLINKNNNSINLSEYTHDTDLLPLLRILVLLYADDTVLIANDHLSLHKSLNDVMEFCTQWKLEVNIEKAKVIIVGARNTNGYNFLINGSNIESVDSYKYLGIFISKTSNFNRAKKQLIYQADKALHVCIQ